MTVAAIAKEAFDSAAAELPDVIKVATLKRITPNYNPTTGGTSPSTNTATGRVLIADLDPNKNPFGNLVVTPGDSLTYLEGFAAMPPQVADKLSADSRVWEILAASDVAQAHGFWVAAVRPTKVA